MFVMCMCACARMHVCLCLCMLQTLNIRSTSWDFCSLAAPFLCSSVQPWFATPQLRQAQPHYGVCVYVCRCVWVWVYMCGVHEWWWWWTNLTRFIRGVISFTWTLVYWKYPNILYACHILLYNVHYVCMYSFTGDALVLFVINRVFFAGGFKNVKISVQNGLNLSPNSWNRAMPSDMNCSIFCVSVELLSSVYSLCTDSCRGKKKHIVLFAIRWLIRKHDCSTDCLVNPYD